MHAFLIELDNEVGELAGVTEAIAAKDINITGFAGATCSDGGGTAVVLTNDEDGTEAVLQSIPVGYRWYEVVEVTLPNEPGSLAGAARRLADAGVNIEGAIPTGMNDQGIVVGFVASDPETARRVLA
jgi:hypothetical protein